MVTRTRSSVHYVSRTETGDFDGDGTEDSRTVVDQVVTTETIVEYEPGEEQVVDRKVTTRTYVDENENGRVDAEDRPVDSFEESREEQVDLNADGQALVAQADAQGEVHYWAAQDVAAYNSAVAVADQWADESYGYRVVTPDTSVAQDVYSFPVYGTGGDGWGANIQTGELRVDAETLETTFVSSSELEAEAELIAQAEAQLPPGYTVANYEQTDVGALFEVYDPQHLMAGYAALSPTGDLNFIEVDGARATQGLEPNEVVALVGAGIDPAQYAAAAQAYEDLDPEAMAQVLALTTQPPPTLPDAAQGEVFLVAGPSGTPQWVAEPPVDAPYLSFSATGAPVVGLPDQAGEYPLAIIQGVELDHAVETIDALGPADFASLSATLGSGVDRADVLTINGEPVLAAHAEQAMATLAYQALEVAAADPAAYQQVVAQLQNDPSTVTVNGRAFPVSAVNTAMQLRAFEAMPGVQQNGQRATDPAVITDYAARIYGQVTGAYPPSYGVASLANLTTFAATGSAPVMGGAIDYTNPDVYAEYLHQLYLPAVSAFQAQFPGAEVSIVAMPGGAFDAYNRSPEGGQMADLQYQLDTLAIQVTTADGETQLYTLNAAAFYDPPLYENDGYGTISNGVLSSVDQVLHDSGNWPQALTAGLTSTNQAYEEYTVPFTGEGGLFQPVTVVAEGQETMAVLEGTEPLISIDGAQLTQAFAQGPLDPTQVTSTITATVRLEGPNGPFEQPVTLAFPPQTNVESVFQQDAIRGDVPIVIAGATPAAQQNLLAFQLGAELGLPPAMDGQSLPPQVAALLAQNPPDVAAFSALMQDPAVWGTLNLYPPGTPQGDLVAQILTHVTAEQGPGPINLTTLHVVVEQPGQMPQTFPVFRFERADGSTYFVDHTGHFYEDWEGSDGFLNSPTYPPDSTVYYPTDGRISTGPDGLAQFDSMVSPATVDTFGEHFDRFMDVASVVVGVGVGVVGLFGGPMTWWMSAAAFGAVGWQVKEGVERVQNMSNQHMDMASPEALWEYANIGFNVFGMMTMGATSLASLTRAGSGFRAVAGTMIAANNALDIAGLAGDTAFGLTHWDQMSDGQRMGWLFGVAMRAGNTGRGLWATHQFLGSTGQPNGPMATLAGLADPNVQRWLAFGPDELAAVTAARAASAHPAVDGPTPLAAPELGSVDSTGVAQMGGDELVALLSPLLSSSLVNQNYDSLSFANEFLDYYQAQLAQNPDLTPEQAFGTFHPSSVAQLDARGGSHCVGMALDTVARLRELGIDAYVTPAILPVPTDGVPFGHAAVLFRFDDGAGDAGFVLLDPGLNMGQPVVIRPGVPGTMDAGGQHWTFTLSEDGQSIAAVRETRNGTETSTFLTSPWLNPDESLTRNSVTNPNFKLVARAEDGTPTMALQVNLNSQTVRLGLGRDAVNIPFDDIAGIEAAITPEVARMFGLSEAELTARVLQVVTNASQLPTGAR